MPSEAIHVNRIKCWSGFGSSMTSKTGRMTGQSTRVAPFGKAAQLVHARLHELLEICHARGFEGVDGVLMDLGLCSAQLDERERGFSFDPGSDARPLDMRMDRSRGETAAELLARLDEKELGAVLQAGDVPAPLRTARVLRAHRPLNTTHDLLDAVATLPRPRRRHHPATLIFQALRLAVNEELTDLERALEGALELLAPGGRLVVLSYHSGEDRRVKAFLKREERGCICPPDLPRCGCGRSPRLRIVERGKVPDPDEILRNPRARSARLRAAERR